MAIGRLSVCTGAKGKASAHAQYIAREGKYAKDENIEKLEHTEVGNMPKWAQADPNFFWKMADEYERKNGSTYREHVITLPRELNEAQRLALIHDWIEQEIGDKFAYQFAIHTPKAMDGKEQPHCHLMFSERTIDGIERDPDQYFKRYNAKNPERGGAKKANTGIPPAERKAELSAQRDRWEKMCNSHLELANQKARISMKSLAARGISREPINFSMAQINTPEIRKIYEEKLVASSQFQKEFREYKNLNVVNELNSIYEKYNEQADTAVNAASAAIDRSERTIKAIQRIAKDWPAYGHRETRSLNYVIEDTKQRVSSGQRLTTIADQAISSSQRAIADSQQQSASTDRAIETKLDEKNTKIKERSAFDLLDIRMESLVINKHTRRKDDSLSGNIPIGNIINSLSQANNEGHKVLLYEGNNSHLKDNETAQSIKKFMLKNLNDKKIRFDYANLSIQKFTDEYELKCDLSDLRKLNDINPPEPVTESKLTAQQPSAPKIKPQRDDDYDFSI